MTPRVTAAEVALLRSLAGLDDVGDWSGGVGHQSPDPRSVCERIAADALGTTHGIPLEELYEEHLATCHTCCT